MNRRKHGVARPGLSLTLACLLLAGSAEAAYRNRLLISANMGGTAVGADYQTHGCLGQNVVSDWQGLDSARIITGIMQFSELYSWILPVMNESDVNQLPGEFQLHQNFPNPFNPLTTIRYDMPKSVHVNISVYNTRGQQVAVLVNGSRQSGYHEVIWDAAGLASGVYFYRIHAGDYVALKKLMLIK